MLLLYESEVQETIGIPSLKRETMPSFSKLELPTPVPETSDDKSPAERPAAESANESSYVWPTGKLLAEQVAKQEVLVTAYRKFDMLCLQAKKFLEGWRAAHAVDIDLNVAAEGSDGPLPQLSLQEETAANIMVGAIKKLPELGFAGNERLLLAGVRELFQKGPEAIEDMRLEFALKHFNEVTALNTLTEQLAAQSAAKELVRQAEQAHLEDIKKANDILQNFLTPGRDS